MTQTILVLDAISEDVAQKMRDLLPPDFELNYAKEPGDDHLVEIIGQADYAISGQVAVNGRIFRAAKQLQLLHKWGVGVDNLDLEAARECGACVNEADRRRPRQALLLHSHFQFQTVAHPPYQQLPRRQPAPHPFPTSSHRNRRRCFPRLHSPPWMP